MERSLHQAFEASRTRLEGCYIRADYFALPNAHSSVMIKALISREVWSRSTALQQKYVIQGVDIMHVALQDATWLQQLTELTREQVIGPYMETGERANALRYLVLLGWWWSLAKQLIRHICPQDRLAQLNETFDNIIVDTEPTFCSVPYTSRLDAALTLSPAISEDTPFIHPRARSAYITFEVKRSSILRLNKPNVALLVAPFDTLTEAQAQITANHLTTDTDLSMLTGLQDGTWVKGQGNPATYNATTPIAMYKTENLTPSGMSNYDRRYRLTELHVLVLLRTYHKYYPEMCQYWGGKQMRTRVIAYEVNSWLSEML
ncbi:hypothetical protein BDW22DRAFT_1343037 [Trametopsis cervina]|nr:hypothetical protein BDW22DRAFT_1343037 [Trametopsis cervina]